MWNGEAKERLNHTFLFEIPSCSHRYLTFQLLLLSHANQVLLTCGVVIWAALKSRRSKWCNVLYLGNPRVVGMTIISRAGTEESWPIGMAFRSLPDVRLLFWSHTYETDLCCFVALSNFRHGFFETNNNGDKHNLISLNFSEAKINFLRKISHEQHLLK